MDMDNLTAADVERLKAMPRDAYGNVVVEEWESDGFHVQAVWNEVEGPAFFIRHEDPDFPLKEWMEWVYPDVPDAPGWAN